MVQANPEKIELILSEMGFPVGCFNFMFVIYTPCCFRRKANLGKKKIGLKEIENGKIKSVNRSCLESKLCPLMKSFRIGIGCKNYD
jgi:hypothetical protein